MKTYLLIKEYLLNFLINASLVTEVKYKWTLANMQAKQLTQKGQSYYTSKDKTKALLSKNFLLFRLLFECNVKNSKFYTLR